MSDQEKIYQQIAKVLEELFEIDPDDIHPEANLYQDLDIDSIDAVDLVVELKKMTGKKIKPEDFKSVRTVQDVVTEVEKLLS
ncbi:acyl carrier protein [Marinobacterium sp. D7]|uniref:acyl carrier protein n=1 Tax=Marinobacterium ramblicola TaxID=2849041 RepID=UPI001C2D8D35|nr:acyl carrier protein [Marinobacterium ramblicola]MBV1788292.1 acyl carrier protein [Marinobacterium ramblicola]